MKFKIFPYYLTLIIFFLLNIYNVLGNYNYEIFPLTPDDINITDIYFEKLENNKTIIELNQKEVKSNIFEAYIKFHININSSDEISLQLKLRDDLNETTSVEIYFYHTDDIYAIINDSSKEYIKGTDSLRIRTYNLSFYNRDFYYIKLKKIDPEITDNRLQISFYNINNDISDDKTYETTDNKNDINDDDKRDTSDDDKSDDTSDDDKSDTIDEDKSDDTSDDDKSDTSDDDKSDDTSDDDKSDTSDDEKSDDTSDDDKSEEEEKEKETNEEEESEEETSKEEEREEEEEEEIIVPIIYTYELEFGIKKDYDDNNILPEESEIKTKNSTFYYYKRDKDMILNNKTIILTLLSSGLNNFDIRYDFYLSNQTKIDGQKLETKHFFNGYSLIINNKLFNVTDEIEKYIKFELTLEDETEIITIKTRKYEKEIKDIKAGDSFDILLEEENIEEQCFTFKNEKDQKYILNFRSLTKNIIATISNVSDPKEITINKESMTGIIDIKKDINNTICFTFVKNSIYDFGSISFEVMESKNDSNIVIYNNFPVIRGLWTHHYLLKNTSTFYKPEIYLNGQQVKVNFHMTKGYLELYKAKCDDKSCNTTLPKYKDINGFISIKENETNYTSLVYCTNENDCEFDIEIKNVEEPSYLFENLKVYSFNFEDDKETYKINTKELKDEEKNIIINIYSFYDKPNILLSTNTSEKIIIEPFNYYLMENKLYYRIPYNKYEKTDYLNVKIDGKDGESKFYYGINYQLKTENEIATYSLENSILYYYQMNEKEINFDFINKDKDKDFLYTYILSVNSFGNQLTLKINENEKIDFNNYIQKEINNTDKFKILNENGDDSFNLFNLEYHELSKHNKLFIENGHLYKNQLNKKNNEIVYSLFIFNISEYNKIVINFRKYSSTSVNIEFDNNNISSININELSKLIILDEKKDICNKDISDYCEFTLKIKAEKKDLNEEIDFSIQITEYNNNSTLVYLPQNTYMGNNILIPNYNTTYYVKIEKEKEGKIYVDFPEGEGLSSATINIDEKNIPLNYYNKAFDIKSEDTKKCKDICTIYINIFLDEIKYKSWYKYNIYAKIKLKNEDKFNFYVPELEYIYGYLENENDEHSYVTKITKNINKVAFHIICDDCHLNISYKSNNIDILFRDEFILEPKENDFKGKEIKYKIKNNDLVSSQRYIIKVIPFESSNELSIPVNSIKNEFCKTRNHLCSFLIRKEYYNKINKIRLLVPNHDKARIKINENGVTTLNKNYKKEYIKKDIYYWNVKESSNEGKYKEIVVDDIDIDKEKTYKITVELDYDDMITFVTTQYDLVSDPIKYIYPEDYIIREVVKDNIIISPLEPNGFLHYDINLIKGNGTIKSLLNNEEYKLESGIKDHLNLLFETESDENSGIEIKSLDFIFYYRIIQNNNNNLTELNFQKTNYLKYLNIKNDSIWPLNFYMKVNITKKDNSDLNLKDINFNYKFSKLYEINRFKPCDELYKTTFYLVNENYIAELKYKNDMNEKSYDIKYTSEYREDITAGYSLINANNISKVINDNSYNGNYYLLISLDYNSNFTQNDHNQEINAAITIFDYTHGYTLPMNEYLLLLINQKRNISISKTYENDQYQPFIEFALQNTSINPNSKVDNISNYGKTFYKLGKDQIYTLTLDVNNTKDITDIASNLLIKYGLSNHSDYSYFKINNDNIEYDKIDKTMSFERIMVNNNNQFLYDNNDTFYDIYTIKIYQVKDNISFIPETIYENTVFNHSIKTIGNSDNNRISYDISFIDYGYYYLSVLAEGRLGNVYEYLLYKSLYIEKISNLTEENITITYDDNIYTPNYTRSVKFMADLEPGAGDEDYIKLSLKHQNYDDKNYIYVSTDDTLYNSTELYKDSEYKVINRNTSLIIPVKEVKDKLLYIRIPCNDLCDYTFYYKIYKKKEVLIKDNECFDININDTTVYFKYNIDNDNNKKSSLFTMTSYSISDLTDFIAKISENDLQKTYFNGYSYLYEPGKYLTKEENNKNTQLQFIISSKSRINVCHRFLNNNEALYKNNDDTNIDYQKIIFDGDIKYSRIQSGKKDCFIIYKNYEYKEDIAEYKINFITKTKNIKINLYSKNETLGAEEQLVNEESFNYTFKPNYDEFCISKNDDKSNDDEDASVLFQLLSITNTNYINQNLYMPLIKGISTKQNLEKGKILYYRINENSKNSEFINVNFQTISGNPKVYHSKATNFPYYNISKIKDSEHEITGFHNNIKYSIKIEKENEDIYQKSSFPIIVVYCPIEEGESDDCNYYIEMSNELETILLNRNRKIYSYIDNSNETKGEDQYKIDLSSYGIDDSSEIYIQLYSFTGEPKLAIDGYTNNYYTYNDNGMIFNLNLKESKLEFKIRITGNHKNTNYSLFYYITNAGKNDFYLPSGEVHYNIIPEKGVYYYYFQDYLKIAKISYIVSINSINCDLNINNLGQKRHYQLDINSHEKISISNEDQNITCEFTISAIEKSNNINKPNELIANDRTYQFYKFSKDFKSLDLYYLMTPDDLKDNKNIYLYISKKTTKQLKINYNINHNKSIIYNHNEMIELKNINKSELSKQFNLYILIITIEPNENINNFEFKIKINGNKNKYSSYLDPEEVESDIIVKGKPNKYYYEYYYREGKDEIIGQIYLDCKGMAQLVNSSDSEIILTKKSNYININNDPNCVNGCKLNFSVLISNEEENNDYNIYNIYLISNYKTLNVYPNINIYGKQYNKMKPLFTTEIDIDQNGNELIFNLNCLKCSAHIKIGNSYYDIEKSKIINIDGSNRILTYDIESQDTKVEKNENNYYFSILNKNSPKFIYQKEAIICKNNCKFILPIYSYFSFTQKNIVFYVPETEKVEIYAKIINMEDYQFKDFDLVKDNDKNSTVLPITNRLYIKEEDYKEKDFYILIEVNSALNNPFNFIVSEFNKLLIEDDKKVSYPKNLYIIQNNSDDNYISFDNNNNNKYKIRMNLINGSGYISLKNNDKNENYNLNYQNQEIISLPNKNNDINKIYLYNSLVNEDFIVYMDIENNNNIYDLILQKTNYIKYLYNKYEKFTITLNIEKIKIDHIDTKDLFINYHFSYLEGKNNSEFINSLDEYFISEIKGIIGTEGTVLNDEKNIIIQYYNDTRRGYIYIDSSIIKGNYNSFQLIIEGKTNYQHKNVYLEVTPLYIDRGDESIEFPRNTYIEYYCNKQTICFSKPNKIYNILKVEYAYKDNLPLNLSLDDDKEKLSVGKYSFNIINDSLKYCMKIEKKIIDHLLLKYTLKQENQSDFNIFNNNNTLQCDKNSKTKNMYKITHNNIKINQDNITNYNVSYLIRLYNYLEYLEANEINNIYTNTRLLKAVRKQLNDSEKKSNQITYNFECGEDLDFGDYSISVLGEVYYNDNVEYFSYDLFKFSIIKDKTKEFDITWIAPLIFVIVVFIIIVSFIIKHCISSKKEKKNTPSEGTLLTNKISI